MSFKSPTYQSWACMKRRCTDPEHASWVNYGGRGIDYPLEWDDFDNFVADMGERPEGCTLDRLDSDLSYSKDNCRWATHSEQMNNRSNSRVLVVAGLPLSVAEWSELTGLEAYVMHKRLRLGWPHADVVLKPLRHWQRKAI